MTRRSFTLTFAHAGPAVRISRYIFSLNMQNCILDSQYLVTESGRAYCVLKGSGYYCTLQTMSFRLHPESLLLTIYTSPGDDSNDACSM
jgi:tRNA1(Val) A37 N6-methylase TrmN6